MARDQDIEIGKKRTLVFFKGRVNDNTKMKTSWIMHEYELTATLPNQATFVLCKLKRKFEKAEVSCIEEGQPSHYLPPNLGNYIANNANQAEAARCLTANSNPNEMLTQLEALNDHEELEHQSIEWWNSYVGGGFPKHDGSGDFGTHGAENAIPNIPMGQEVLQDQSGTNEQDISNLGDLVPGDERSNQRKLVMDDDGCNMPSNSENDTAEDSVKMDLSTFAGPSTDEEVFAGLEALPETMI
ncbi:NAC domain-containing protein 86-like [Gossypium australe]|uniref:NAC domain-containing protein 86-like n=1 Tax=Gossypium australe TaxID=47621 RepID=A0A5B6W229_9ROSI|nr:NAC domain-containing protein 86-like [Gossypium australe]